MNYKFIIYYLGYELSKRLDLLHEGAASSGVAVGGPLGHVFYTLFV